MNLTISSMLLEGKLFLKYWWVLTLWLTMIVYRHEKFPLFPLFPLFWASNWWSPRSMRIRWDLEMHTGGGGSVNCSVCHCVTDAKSYNECYNFIYSIYFFHNFSKIFARAFGARTMKHLFKFWFAPSSLGY